jgi:hypothetical protein
VGRRGGGRVNQTKQKITTLPLSPSPYSNTNTKYSNTKKNKLAIDIFKAYFLL